MLDTVARLMHARRYLAEVLINLPINTTETTVATLLTMMDHFIDNPDDYREFLKSTKD
jgi:hypothetical protein